MIPIFKAKRVNGKRLLRFQHEDRFRDYLLKFKEDTVLDVMVRKRSKARSLPQNRYYWGVVIDMVAEETGFEPEDAHLSLREKFLSFTDAKTGLTIIRSTTSLSTVEFREYCDKIQRWAAEWLGVVIPDPDGCLDWASNEYYG